jgi:hypothetical protein
METLGKLLKQGKHEELWQKCCGFIDLNLADFMKIQRRLLMEQIELLSKCEMGRHIMNGANPQSIEEFRQRVPLTTYASYAPYLPEQMIETLPEKPVAWVHTSGRSGEYPFKWVPVSQRQYDEMGILFLAILIFGSCKQRGEVKLRVHDKYLYLLAPAPYYSGVAGRRMAEEHVLDFLPPLHEADSVQFAERIAKGFKLALFEGLDIFAGISSILVGVGERFSQGNQQMSVKPFLLHPKALLRVTRGLVRSKIEHRPLLPKDIWSLKGVMAGGTDTTIFGDKIKQMWGKQPLNVYACTEGSVMATQTWGYRGMTFVPHLNFYEFIPEKESLRSKEDPSFQPLTLLLDEVRAGENYEIVITNLMGGSLVRYCIGDMIKIISLRDAQVGIETPQIAFHSRVDDMIDIAGFTRLTEGVIWQAIENTGIPYNDWTIRKEVKESPVLHLYLELKENGENEHISGEQLAIAIHNELKKLDNDYANLEAFAGLKPL